MIGMMLGPYRVLEKIGEGGMGEVYKAKDTRLDRTVAIKLFPAEVSADPERRVRFEREARAIASLAHPHICPLYDVGEHNGSTFLVMEHLAGETLTARLEKGRLPLEQALTIATETADALPAAHRQGIIHRDLKPGNVMLTNGAAGQTPPSFVRKRRSWRFTAAVTLGAACLTVVGIAVWMQRAQQQAAAPARGVFKAVQLTDQPGRECFPSLSPDGKSVIYASRTRGNWDVCLQRAGGGNPVKLTRDSQADDSEPHLSPDGEWVAFRSEREGGGIFIMGATG